MNRREVRELLEFYHDKYNRPGFIEEDPVSIPHLFSAKQDQEIMGFFAAVLAWGRRSTILQKCHELIGLMDGAPYDFVQHHTPADLKVMEHFVHRTFNATDLLYFIAFFRKHYEQNDSLETAFRVDAPSGNGKVYDALETFRSRFFSLEYAPVRTGKHIARPSKNSSCKRLNMFLRWMVRRDKRGVDLGIWTVLSSADLMCPLDVHVERTSRKLGLLKRKQRDWKSVEELTNNLRKFDPEDPVRYDLALFGMGLEGHR